MLIEILIHINLTIARKAAVIIICLGLFVSPGVAYGVSGFFPELNPPLDEREPGAESRLPASRRALAPSVEWEYHKTSDNRHPDDSEQQMMWLMNRARSNPTAEGIWLADIYDRYHIYLPDCGRLSEDAGYCYIAGAIEHWGVDLDLMQNEFAGYDAKPPAAFDVRLYRAAENHSEYLISIDGQNHTDQFSRIDDELFFYRRARGNVFSNSLDAVYGHAAFNVDWGPDGGSGSGMQSPPGHRLAIMSIDGDYTNVGIAAVPSPDSAATVGPLIITGNYCEANPSSANHYNRFLVGTVWSDKDDDHFYDPGEGIGGITVMPDHGTYFAVTSNAGGYALPIPAPGAYSITFSGSALEGNAVKTGSGSDSGDTVVKSVTVVDESVLLDLIVESASTSALAGTDDGGGQGCFIAATSLDNPATKHLRIFHISCSVVLIGAAVIPRASRSPHNC